MKKALNAWSVNESLDFEATFAAVSRAGFDGIELNIDKPGRPHSLTLASTDADYAAIRALSEKYKLPIISIATSLNNDMSGVRELHGEYRRLIQKEIEAAKALGATGILTSPGGLRHEGITLKTAREATLDFFKSMRSEIEAEGIFVGLENVWNGFMLSPYDMTAIIDEIGSSCIGAYFDAGNMIAFSDSEYWVEVLGSRIGLVHVKDFKRISHINSGGAWANITEGSAKWDKIIPALRKAGFDGYLTGEVFDKKPEQSWDEYLAMVAKQIGSICQL